MPRINPEVERLEREVKVLRSQIEAMRKEPGDFPLDGCGNMPCYVSPPKGLHTNGHCRCSEQKLRTALQWWKRMAEFRQVTIQELREAVRQARRDGYDAGFKDASPHWSQQT